MGIRMDPFVMEISTKCNCFILHFHSLIFYNFVNFYFLHRFERLKIPIQKSTAREICNVVSNSLGGDVKEVYFSKIIFSSPKYYVFIMNFLLDYVLGC